MKTIMMTTLEKMCVFGAGFFLCGIGVLAVAAGVFMVYGSIQGYYTY